MLSRDSLSGSVPLLADRLKAARRRRFVGRVAEADLFRAALVQGGSAAAVFYIYGPGGVGKTVLLNEFARIAEETGATAVFVDGRNVDLSPAGFVANLRQALAVSDDISPIDALARRPRTVLLIDTFEDLVPIDPWLRETFLPSLPDQVLTVIAGRTPPTLAWRADPAWHDLVRIVPLRNLSPEESCTYLRGREVPDSQHAAVLAFTHGHPLALALVADLVTHGEHRAFSPDHAHDVVRVLLERIIQRVPSATHRHALEVAARTRVTTEDLLGDVLGSDIAPALFAWLRGLSFVEHGSEGLLLHDLAREVLDSDLRWRDAERFREIHSGVLRALVRRLQARAGPEQQRAYFDLLYLSRNNPLMRPYYEWKSMGAAYAEPAIAEDFPTILAMVRRHEGESSARIAMHWLGRQPDAFLAFRGADRQLTGFTAVLLLGGADPEDCAVDPAVAAAWQFVRRYGPLRPSERIMYHRFSMGREAYQDPKTRTLTAAVAGIRWLTTPRLAWSFPAVADPDSFPHFPLIEFPRATEADFEVDGRRYGVFAHDWRVEPPLVWIERKGLLEFQEARPPSEPSSRAPLLVLSRPDFDEAVRRALRDYTRPDALAANPLLRSRVVAEHASGESTAATLQSLLREAADHLRGNPKDEKRFFALRRAYFEPAATQELAAELLGLPFSTYRYHLTGGLARVTEWLWQREVHGIER